jgi:hypothetical protein
VLSICLMLGMFAGPGSPGGGRIRTAAVHGQEPVASVQGDPVFMRRVNSWVTVVWLFMVSVSLITLGDQRRLRVGFEPVALVWGH